MNLEKVVFGFFVVLAATLNFGYVVGDISDPHMHNSYELLAAVVVNLIATVLKFGDRTQLGAVHLATSLVADVQLIAGAIIWTWAAQLPGGMNGEHMATIVSLSGGALLANLISVVLMISEIITARR